MASVFNTSLEPRFEKFLQDLQVAGTNIYARCDALDKLRLYVSNDEAALASLRGQAQVIDALLQQVNLSEQIPHSSSDTTPSAILDNVQDDDFTLEILSIDDSNNGNSSYGEDEEAQEDPRAALYRLHFLACHLLSTVLRSESIWDANIPPVVLLRTDKERIRWEKRRRKSVSSKKSIDQMKHDGTDHLLFHDDAFLQSLEIDNAVYVAESPLTHPVKLANDRMPYRRRRKHRNQNIPDDSPILSRLAKNSHVDIHGTMVQTTADMARRHNMQTHRTLVPGANARTHLNPSKIGYDVPTIWYPINRLKKNNQNNNNTDDEAPKIDISLPRIKSGSPSKKLRKQQLGRFKFKKGFDPGNEERTEQNDNEYLRFMSPKNCQQFLRRPDEKVTEFLIRTIVPRLLKTLHDERILGKSIDKTITQVKYGLPLSVLMEHKLDPERCNMIFQHILSRMADVRVRPSMRWAIASWKNIVRHERMVEFVRALSARKLKNTILRICHRRQERVLQQWREHILLLKKQARIRAKLMYVEIRNRAALLLQRRRRGVLGRRLYAIAKKKYDASVRMQAAARGRNARSKYRNMIFCIIFEQKCVRRWRVTKMIKLWNASALRIQRHFRGMRVVKAITDLNYFAVVIQSAFRAFNAVLRARVIYLEISTDVRRRWAASFRIQRFFRMQSAKKFLEHLRVAQLKEHAAALFIQRAWYRYQDQFTSLILMRSLLVRDMLDEEMDAIENRKARQAAAISMQLAWRKTASTQRRTLLKNQRGHASCIQRNVRRWVIECRMVRFRHAWANAIVIQRRTRNFLLILNTKARVIQCRWWQHTPGNLLVHLKVRKEVRRLHEQRRAFLKLSSHAIRIQRRVRMLSAVRLGARLCAGFTIVRIGRGFLGRLRVMAIRKAIRTAQVALAVDLFVKKAYMSATNWINRRRRQAVVTMQAVVRRGLARKKFRKIRRRFRKRRRAATKIQCFVRHTTARCILNELIAKAKKAAKNRYKKVRSIHGVLSRVLMHGGGFHNPWNTLAGMHPSEWLMRLSLAPLWLQFQMSRLDTLDKVLRCTAKGLERAGVTEPIERGRITSMCRVSKLVNFRIQAAEQNFSLYDTTKAVSAARASVLHEAQEHDPESAQVFQDFATLPADTNFEAMFLSHFSGQALRAEAFGRKMAVLEVSTLQIQAFFKEFEGNPRGAREHIEDKFLLACDRDAVDLWDARRMLKCFLLYEMALERIRDILPQGWIKQEVLGVLLRLKKDDKERFKHKQKKQPHKSKCKTLRIALDRLKDIWGAVVVAQRVCRGHLSRKVSKKLRTAAKLRALDAAYKEEIMGGLVQKRFREDQERARLARKEQIKQWRRYEFEQNLATVLRYGWASTWNESSQSFYFEVIDESSSEFGMSVWEDPFYEMEHNDACVKIQAHMRRVLAIRIAQTQRLCLERARKKEEEKADWEGRIAERSQIVAVRLRVTMLHGTTKKDRDTLVHGECLPWRKNWGQPILFRRQQVEIGANKNKEKANSPRKRIRRNALLPIGLERVGAKDQQNVADVLASNKVKLGTVQEECDLKLAELHEQHSKTEQILEWAIESAEKLGEHAKRGLERGDRWFKLLSKPPLRAGETRLPDSEKSILHAIDGIDTATDWRRAIFHPQEEESENGVVRYYFYNQVTGETSWEMPEEMLTWMAKTEALAAKEEVKEMKLNDRTTTKRETELQLMLAEDIAVRARKRELWIKCNLSYLAHFSDPPLAESLSIVFSVSTADSFAHSATGMRVGSIKDEASTSSLRILSKVSDNSRKSILSFRSKQTTERQLGPVQTAADAEAAMADALAERQARLNHEHETATVMMRVIRGGLDRLRVRKMRADFKVQDVKLLLQEIADKIKKTKRRRANAHVSVGMFLEDTFVDIPFGWIAARDGYARNYYHNASTGETQWTRPEYEWVHELATRTIQKVFRGQLGRNRFLSILKSVTVEDIIAKAKRDALSLGCFGFGLEGLTVEMWFARMGLYTILPDVKLTSNAYRNRYRIVTNFLPWTAQTLGDIGFERDNNTASASPTNRSRRGDNTEEKTIAQAMLLIRQSRTRLKSTVWPLGATGLDLISDDKVMVDAFTRSFPSHGKRAAKFSSTLAASSTPISGMQLVTHLAKYKGRASFAANQAAAELGDKPTVSDVETLRDTHRRLSHAVRRVSIVVGNLKLISLQQDLNGMLRTAENLAAKGSAHVLEHEGKSIMKQWHCAFPFHIVAACTLMRKSLDVVQAWVDSTVRVQIMFRSVTSVRQWKRAVKRWHECAIVMECAWRVASAKMHTAWLIEQHDAPWKEYYDDANDRMFYHNSVTDETQWHRPKEEPYCPHDWWPPKQDNLPVPEGICVKCLADPAVRVCLECQVMSSTGEYQRYCFACFARVHGRGRDLALHRFETIQVSEPTAMACAQCEHAARRTCLSCEDNYCLACYRRTHAKGARREHHWNAFRLGALACAECQHELATRRCRNCEDVHCERCYPQVHKHGKKKRHTYERIEEKLTPGMGL